MSGKIIIPECVVCGFETLMAKPEKTAVKMVIGRQLISKPATYVLCLMCAEKHGAMVHILRYNLHDIGQFQKIGELYTEVPLRKQVETFQVLQNPT